MNYFLFKRINKIIAVGKGVEDDVLSSNYAVPAHKVSAEGNSVDYERFANAPVNRRQAREQFELSPEAFVFGTVGRMMPDKGQKYLISAFSTVKKINPSACLIMVGYGQLRAELERQARETGFADSIFFTGYKKDVAQVLPAMDAFVLASFSEGIPRVLMEAMSAGIPCIATNISGNPEVIDDGISGLLVPPKDVNSMADAMIKMIQMPPSERNNMIEAARQKIMKSFNHQNIANQVEKLYEDEFHKANLQKN